MEVVEGIGSELFSGEVNGFGEAVVAAFEKTNCLHSRSVDPVVTASDGYIRCRPASRPISE